MNNKENYIKASNELLNINIITDVRYDNIEEEFFLNFNFNGSDRKSIYEKIKEHNELNYIFKLNKNNLVEIDKSKVYELVYKPEKDYYVKLFDFNKKLKLAPNNWIESTTKGIAVIDKEALYNDIIKTHWFIPNKPKTMISGSLMEMTNIMRQTNSRLLHNNA